MQLITKNKKPRPQTALDNLFLSSQSQSSCWEQKSWPLTDQTFCLQRATNQEKKLAYKEEDES